MIKGPKRAVMDKGAGKSSRGRVVQVTIVSILLAALTVFPILPDGTFKASTRDPKGYEHSLAISQYLYNQVEEASEHPDEVSDFYIPDYRGTELEWAISEGIATNISDTLYSQGIIEHIPELNVIYDASLN